MNQTQRNFAFQKAFEKIIDKLEVAAKKDAALIKERNLFIFGSVHVQEAIVSGKLKPYPKTTKRKFEGINKDLSSFFPLADFHKKRTTLADKKGMVKPNLASDYCIYLIGPKSQRHSWHGREHSVQFHQQLSSAQAVLNQFETDLMLGSSEEAKKLLANIDNLSF